MKWAFLPLLMGFFLLTWSRIGYISESGTRVFLMACAKMVAALLGTVLMILAVLMFL